MKDENIHIGCSSYTARDWLETFYPVDLPPSKWFAFYTSHFGCYELNATFYKFPTVRSLANWNAKTPEGFAFSVKAPKIITHIKKFEDCGTELASFYATCAEGLGAKLKCLLFQLPPSYGYTEQRLKLLLEQLDTSYRNVVEFRNETWWTAPVFEAFSRAGITFCCPNYPKLPSGIIATNPMGYIRLHGNPRLFYSEYTRTELKKIWDQIRAKKFTEVFIFFNNTASVGGINNARAMDALARSGQGGSAQAPI